ncbi:MAG: hypothetical protein JRN59_07315 [Nitrososphaerota archaeon]|nr:hypothetical protein [Nitrososphaerota archaeon]
MSAHKMPLRIRGRYVGDYEAEVCQVCRRFFFTRGDYDDALREAVARGILGSPEMRPGLALVQFVVKSGQMTFSAQSSNVGQKEIHEKSGNGNFEPTSDWDQEQVSLIPVDATG